MHPPILTITIPTYNRFETVCANINRLVPQLSPDVCLLVIDNASTDGTRNLTEWVRDNHPDAPIRVIRNVTNVGAGANVTRSFELVDTPWVWTLSDDDPVHPDAVDGILDVIDYCGLKKDALIESGKKIDAFDPPLIHTVRGVGYRLRMPPK